MSGHGLRPNMTDNMRRLRVTTLTSQKKNNGNTTEIRNGK